MCTIAQHERLAKLPVAALEAEIEQFVEPVTKRFVWQKVVLASTSPHANGRREHGMRCKLRRSG
jgi:hypothetical protein